MPSRTTPRSWSARACWSRSTPTAPSTHAASTPKPPRPCAGAGSAKTRRSLWSRSTRPSSCGSTAASDRSKSARTPTSRSGLIIRSAPTPPPTASTSTAGSTTTARADETRLTEVCKAEGSAARRRTRQPPTTTSSEPGSENGDGGGPNAARRHGSAAGGSQRPPAPLPQPRRPPQPARCSPSPTPASSR